MDEKLVDGLNKEQWTDRYIAYMKKHSNIEDVLAAEMADISWDESTDEAPEECAEAELSCME